MTPSIRCHDCPQIEDLSRADRWQAGLPLNDQIIRLTHVASTECLPSLTVHRTGNRAQSVRGCYSGGIEDEPEKGMHCLTERRDSHVLTRLPGLLLLWVIAGTAGAVTSLEPRGNQVEYRYRWRHLRSTRSRDQVKINSVSNRLKPVTRKQTLGIDFPRAGRRPQQSLKYKISDATFCHRNRRPLANKKPLWSRWVT